jgi:membrane protein CcdC involved in cytochrome C biogenesis
MNLSKSIILPTLGMATTIFFIGLSYIKNNVFFDELLICGFILSIIFIARIRETLKS